MEPTLDHLNDYCLFCDPSRHGQGDQILLKSDRFYLFAGLGAIVPGYILIAPYRCGDAGGNAESLSQLSLDWMDEFAFLRGIVADYYRERHSTPGLSFEHGRAGGCHRPRDSKTKHCYHAHLCCYPISLALWEGLPPGTLDELTGLHQLRDAVRESPYLYMETSEIDSSKDTEQAAREHWHARTWILGSEEKLESQYLRKRLAKMVGKPELWDWERHRRVDEARRLAQDFRAWLDKRHYPLHPTDGAVSLRFAESIVASNAHGNDRAAARFHAKWGDRLMHGALGRFLRRFPDNLGSTRLRLLDVGCGPGNYLRAFYHLGFDCVGIEPSSEMSQIARQVVDTQCIPSSDGSTPRAQVVSTSVQDFSFEEGSFDAIWFSAVFVHLPRELGVPVLEKMRSLLKPGGVMYLSAQVGSGMRVRYEGRVFFYFSRKELRGMIRRAGLEILEEWTGTTTDGTFGDTREKPWVHFIVGRQQPARIPDAGTLGELGEHALHEHIARSVPRADRDDVHLGIGDDCAALFPRAGELVVATTDPCPQPVLSMLRDTGRDVDGWFSVVISLSDVGAMGARPLGILLAIEAPEETPLSALDAFYAGVNEAAAAYDCPVLGGNVKDAPRFSCVGTALGAVKPDRMLRRDAARPDEWVVVLGEMGRFWAGALHLLENVPLAEDASQLLLASLSRPRPRIREGRMLAENVLARCAMDSSDGLTACFREIARSSGGVDLEIDLSSLEPEPAVDAVARQTGIDARKLMLGWGGWELVCTVAHEDLDRLREAVAELQCPVTVVGRVIGGGSGQVTARERDARGRLANLASERFTSSSYFSHGLDRYVHTLRNTPLIKPE